MRRVIVDERMTLDRGRAGARRRRRGHRGGVQHGGWHTPYFDERSMNWTLKRFDRRVHWRGRSASSPALAEAAASCRTNAAG
jgi:hypothetical protein